MFKILFLHLFYASLFSCTGIMLDVQSGGCVSGRTVEFGVPIVMNAALIPRNFSFSGKTPSGPGLRYQSKYAAVGIYCFDEPVLMDGLNEKGLVAAAFYFPGFAKYTPMTSENQSKAISPVEFPNWVLTQFASLEEVKRALDSIIIAPTISTDWGPEPPPFHYIVYDKEGNSLVIEPVEEGLKVYENPLGIITNSPDFGWHLTNLRNYIHLSPYNAPPLKQNGAVFSQLGQGSGMVGLPGDFTPPSRFVRAVFFSRSLLPSASSSDAVFQAFHLLNQFDIPLGSVREKSGSSTSYDYTMLTSVKDPTRFLYYFKTYQDPNVKVISLKDLPLDAELIQKVSTISRNSYQNISTKLSKYTGPK